MEKIIDRPYKRRLRSVLIHKPIQREFTLVTISLLMISALTIGFVIHATIHQAMLGGGYRFGKISAYEVMSDVSYELITRISIILFLTIMAISLFGIFFLHRIAGPVYRFRNVVHRISGGEIPEEVHLREGDFFGETVEDLNDLLQVLRKKREKVGLLEEKLDRIIRENISSSLTPHLIEIRESLKEMG